MALVLVFSFAVSSIHGLFCVKKIYEGEPFVKIVKIIWDLSGVLFAINLGLKLDGIVTWSWSTVFYPAWIAFAILITASLITIGVMISSLVPIFCCKIKYVPRFLVSFWINMHIVAGAVFVVLIPSSIVGFLDDKNDKDKFSKLSTIVIVFTIYVLALMFSSLIGLKGLM